MNVDQLKKLDIFQLLPEASLIKLAGQCKSIALAPKEILFRDGDTGNNMYVVLEGHLSIFKNDFEIAQIGPGEIFGEMAIIDSKTRSATVKSAGESQVLEITRKHFDSLLASNQQFLFGLLTTFSKRTRGNTQELALGYQDPKNQEKFSEYLYQILDESPNEIVAFDLNDFRIIRLNSLAERNLGYDFEELKGSRLFEIIRNLTPEFLNNSIPSLVDGSESFIHFQGLHLRKNGTIYHTNIRIRLLSTGETSVGILMAEDITDRQMMEERIKTLAHYDPVTGLPNLNMAREKLEGSISNGHQSHRMIAVLSIGISNFKSINHSLGPHSGELLLKDIAKRIKYCLREKDVLARLDGEEFLIIMNDVKHQKNASQMAQRIIEILEPLFSIEDKEVSLNSNIGISLYPPDGKDADTLIKHAGAASFRMNDKQNSYQFYNRSFLFLSTQQLNLEAGLRKAVGRNELHLFYQPKVDLKTMEISGMEALMRWQHPEKGWIPPNEFIPIAEDSGMILPLGEWALQTACRQIQTWKNLGLPPIAVAVNVSGHQFNRESMVPVISKIIEESQIDPSCLELELTESILMDNSEKAISRLSELNNLGVKISIDDFGTGYSSLTYLMNMPIQNLKIDQSFVRDLANNRNLPILRAIVSLAHSLNMETIAEGVENPEERDCLISLGCDFMQGNLFSPPLPGDKITELLKLNNSPL